MGLGTVFGAGTGRQLACDPDWPGAPDVAFELSSPGDRRGEVDAKTHA
jgi:hypothetical protein